MRRALASYTVLLVIAACMQACATRVTEAATTTQRVRPADLPRFDDDLMFAGLIEALERQQHAQKSAEKITLGGVEYSAAHVRASGERLRELARVAQACLEQHPSGAARAECFEAFQVAIASEFVVYTTRAPARFTAYYTPTVEVRRQPNAEFRFPIYRLPDSPRLRQLTRRDIDFRGALENRALELFYGRSRFDLYVLHVEGGGRLRIDADGAVQTAYLSYAGDNGRRFRPIERYMVRQRMLREDVSRFAQREYLRAHPRAAERILASCPWYVFFHETQAPVQGSAGALLTANRSLASDPAHYPVKGVPVFVSAWLPRLPDASIPRESNPTGVTYTHMTRFFVDQDTGPTIKGSERFDLFFGEDEYAEFLANNLQTEGRVYFLMLDALKP